MQQAEVGIEAIRAEVDTLIVVPNQRLLEIANKTVSVVEAFNTADDVLRAGVQGITDLITTPGLINLDFADVKSVMQGAGSALMGIGTAKGEDRAVRAAEMAVSSPLLESSIDGAHGVLLLVQGASDLGLHEIDEAARLVQEAVSPEANIIYGTTIDDTLGDEVRITVIAAGFDGGAPKPRKMPRTVFAEVAESTPVVIAAPVVAEQVSVEPTSFFDIAEAEPTPVPSFASELDAVDQIQIDESPELPRRPQTADGTFGDDLDIPEFLRG
jgi:cell division protein FtsZ